MSQRPLGVGGSRDWLVPVTPDGKRGFESPDGEITGTHVGFYVGMNGHNMIVTDVGTSEWNVRVRSIRCPLKETVPLCRWRFGRRWTARGHGECDTGTYHSADARG